MRKRQQTDRTEMMGSDPSPWISSMLDVFDLVDRLLRVPNVLVELALMHYSIHIASCPVS